MNAETAYQNLTQWALSLKKDMKASGDASERLGEIARVIAILRLTPIAQGPSIAPNREAIKTVVLDYLKKHPGEHADAPNEEHRIGLVLEERISQAADKIVSDQENQPYFGCHLTKDGKPPHPKGPKLR
jgi:hypothetical protein